MSRPLSIAPEKAKTIIVDMEVVPFSTRDRGAIYIDTGNGFNAKEMRRFRLKKGRMVYQVPLMTSKNVLKVRLKPTRKKGRVVKLYSLKIGSNS